MTGQLYRGLLAATATLVALAGCTNDAHRDPAPPPGGWDDPEIVSLEKDTYLVVDGSLMLYRTDIGYFYRHWSFASPPDLDPGDVIEIVEPDDVCLESYPDQCSAETATVLTQAEGILGVRVSAGEADYASVVEGLAEYGEMTVVTDKGLALSDTITVMEPVHGRVDTESVPEGPVLLAIDEPQRDDMRLLGEAGHAPILIVESAQEMDG